MMSLKFKFGVVLGILLISGNLAECNSFNDVPEESRCIVCNSESDVNCAINPDAGRNSVSCNTFSQCYSIVNDGATVRGCISELADELFILCLKDDDGKNCQACSGDNCNYKLFEITSKENEYDVNDLIGEDAGEPGHWQGLPLNCYTCEGEHCASSNGLIKKCLDNDLQTCATVFGSNGKVIARGCSDAVAQSHATHCQTSPNDCFQCKSSGCNVAVSKTDYIDCIFCDSKFNENCTLNHQNVTQTRKCHKACMTALYPRTSDVDPSYNLVRSCLDDKDIDDQETCSSDSLCHSCSTNSLCNTQLIPEVRKTCYHCSGDSCQIPVSRSCRSYSLHEQCFIKFDEEGSASEMGCKSDYDPSDIQEMLLAKKLHLCDSDNCNTFENLPQTHSCRLCNSRTNKFCATDPASVKGSTPCNQLPITSCYTRVLGDGHTERGCLSSLENDSFLKCYNNNTAECVICDEKDCNDEVFPTNRLACHICDSAKDKYCETNPRHTNLCHKHLKDQTCVTALINETTYRGCSSELSCLSNDNSKCRKCNTNNCNIFDLQRLSDANPGVWQSLPLNCYSCSGTECQIDYNNRLSMCTGNDNQYCMTVFDVDGNVIRRGCSDDVELELSAFCDQNGSNCLNCNSNGCNNATSMNEYINCIHCDSRRNKDCVQYLTSTPWRPRRCNTACMVALFPKSIDEPFKFEFTRSCLDDKDLDDREACGNDGTMCKSCTSDNCNQNDVVEDRLECYSCLNESCEDPKPRKCVTYMENDSCFILFDLSNSVKQTGCTSEFTANRLEELSDKMIKCKGNNCNDLSIIPLPNKCAKCDSLVDRNCASSPKDIAEISECNTLPNVECYARISYEGSTVRGCVSDLNRYQRQDCLNGNDKLCSTCNGHKCNIEVFPEDRLTCHKCNSIDDPNCQDKPNSPTVCSVYSANEVCSSKLVDGVTYRGCSSDDFTCDDSEKQYCKMCNTSNCNVVNLYQNNIGYPGQWQDLPINCYSCLEEECDSPSKTRLRKCENNNLQNCVTVFGEDGKVRQKGCSDTISNGPYDHHCDSHSELCTYCKSSGCNDASSLDEYTNCLSCDSATNANCTLNVTAITKTRKCKGKCMTSLYPRSAESDPALELSRSCLDDKDFDDRVECENGKDKLCKTCQDDSCNKDQLPEQRLSCFRCTGDGCEDPVESTCPAYRENDGCFILFDDVNNILQMGCKSDFDNSTLNLLRKKMLFCEGDNCNTLDIIPSSHKCLVCNSTENPLCATTPDLLPGLSNCNSLPLTSCYTMINDEGHTVRGCIADLDIETIDKCMESGDSVKCNVCDDESCNSHIYPEDRQICLRCSSENDELCQSDPVESSACPLYKENDQCGVQIFGETTIRGCRSELNCDGTDPETCRICSTNKCNTVDLLSSYIGKPGQWQDLPLNCFTCEGASCQNSNGQLKACENNNLQKCTTVFEGDVVVRRGCSDDVAQTHGDYCDEHKDSCQQCKSSGCNTVQKLSEYVDCSFCDTTTNPNCVLNPNQIAKTRKCNQQCMVALFPRSSEEDPSYELSRSCLDDKDLDDRVICLNGEDPMCKACSDASCNTFEFPTTDRHECWTCRGNEDCVDARIQKCVQYHRTDQCYILFDNSSSIISMGCRSEFDLATATDLVKSKQMLLCNGKNCNSYESIPAAQTCVVCNSAIDSRCATNPNLIVDSTSCSQLPYTGCFTIINKDGDTERGCQSALENLEFYGCHTQSNSACSTCTGNKCNKDVFPSNRTTCHRCNSLDNEDCAASPSSNEICPKFIDNQSCVTSYSNGITYRGCSSELSCDTSNKKTCRICSGSGCNTANLENVAKDGEPGKWQDLPIKCLTCKDDSCKQSQVSAELCSNNNLQNCMTVFNAEGQVIQRGCSDAVNSVQEEYCETYNNRCFRCNSNECNKASKMDDYIQCLSCDTSTNSSCVTNPDLLKSTRMCYNGCMTALYPKSMEDDPAYDTIRTCLDDKELADQNFCSSGLDGLCKSCAGKECNKENIPEDRYSCWHCSGDGCQLPETKLCSNYRKYDQCTLLLDGKNTIIEAGCKSDYTIEQAETLIKSKNLKVCYGRNCNSFDSVPLPQSCYLCNSKTDPKCSVKPNAIESSTKCSHMPYTQCYTRVLTDGATERGCLSSLEENDFYDCMIGNSTTCESCSGEKCNNDIYPFRRRSCFICDSESDPKCHSKPDVNSLSICPKYKPNDACVTSFIAGVTYRGCETDIQCDTSDRKKCRVCLLDGCNTFDLESKQDDNHGKWQDLPLECYECFGDSCRGSLGLPKKCQDNNEQDCSIVYNTEGRVISRGCSDDVDFELGDHCDQNSVHCFNCKSNSCNGAIGLIEFTDCVYCDSSKNKSCVTNPSSISKHRQCATGCMTALYPSDSSSNPTYELIRTCLSDKEKKDQDNCSGDMCNVCYGKNCNTHDLPVDRLRCHSCLNENCEESVSELCPLYKKDDQCFVRFDSTNSIAEMGCLSQFRSQEVTTILKTKRVFICSGDDCNSPEKLPQAQKCTACDSRDDVNCAIDAHHVGTVASCNALPYPNCYTSISSDGTTQRGCLADLPANDFVNCILSGGDKCSHCLGDMCNREVFPESRLQCYACSSETDPDCEDIPTKLSSCPYIRESEKCVTALGGNRTERGCSSQLLCDTTDKTTCRHCSFNGCNTLNLIDRKDDENHGRWQELPLRCHNCTGSECSNSLGPAVVCTDGDQQDCVTVFDEQGIVVRRGCMFEVEDEQDLYCRKNPNNCISCKSNNCNDAWELNDFETCAYCNSEHNATCITRPEQGGIETRKCQNGCMVASFIGLNSTTQIIRTCLDDKEVQDRHKCSGDLESSSGCSSCSGENCNLFNYPKDRLTCNVCLGPTCSDTVEEHCEAYVKDDRCYAKYEGGELKLLGCLSDIDELTLQEWKEKNELFDCSGENCNAQQNLPQSNNCLYCDSRNHAACAIQPSNVTTQRVCNAPISGCVTQIVGAATQRGCLNELSYNEQSTCGSGSGLCEKCVGEKCNSKVYPSDRRSCYICQSDMHDNCIKEPTILSVCPNYSPNNQCVTKFNGTITERGCSTELTCDVTDEDHCRICNIDGCNTVQLDGVGTIIVNNLLLTVLVAIVSLRSLKSQFI